MMLSPLILVLNTLVAEFLYERNYHYSLSVFCTEVPYQHTLPNFDKIKNFRFTETEIYEIFEAISPSLDIPKEFQKLIINEYLENKKSKLGNSLLYFIFKKIFDEIKIKKMNDKEIQVEQEEKIIKNKNSYKDKNNNSKSNSDSLSNFSKKDKQHSNNYMRYLNKYLLILSRKVKEMSQNVRDIEKCNINPQNRLRKKSYDKKFELLNKSLENISKNLKYFSLTKRKNRKISEILNALDKMTKQFEKCTQNIEIMSQRIISRNFISDNKSEDNKEKTFYEWIDEMKTTKNGKKFLVKVCHDTILI